MTWPPLRDGDIGNGWGSLQDPPSCPECNYNLEYSEHEGYTQLRLAHDPWCPAWKRKQQELGKPRSKLGNAMDRLAQEAIQTGSLVYSQKLKFWFIPDAEKGRFKGVHLTKVLETEQGVCWGIHDAYVGLEAAARKGKVN